MPISEADFEAANQRMAERLECEPHAVAAGYESELGRLIIALSTGACVSIPVDKLEGLRGATPEQLAEIEISPTGFGLHFPKLDADFTVDGLLSNVFGSPKWMASQLGAKGGKASNARKTQAARMNGKLGGRPKKKAETA